MTWQHWLLSGGLVIGGLIFFFVIARFGEKIVEQEAKMSMPGKNNNSENYEFVDV